MVWSPCWYIHGDKLISSSNDHAIKVWSIDTWACERTLEGHDNNAVNCLVVYGDKLLSSSDDSTIKVWGS
jgi:WD40 repeat protein